MGIADFVSVLADVPTLLTLKKGMKPRPLDETDCFGRQVTSTAATHGGNVAIMYGDETQTWQELNEQANRYAGALANLGVGRGDVVSLMMENRPDFLALCISISKLGAVAALINTNLRERPLQHCISVSQSKMCIFGMELAEAVEGVKQSVSLNEGEGFVAVPESSSQEVPNWASNLSALSSNLDPDEPHAQNEVTLRETAFYIFTSGTTGLPKAAIMSNRRFLQMSRLSYIAGLRCTHRTESTCACPCTTELG